MAVTPASARSLRSRASSPALFVSSAPPADGSTGEATTMVPASLATSAAAIPPGSLTTGLASPSPAGSSHSAATSGAAPSCRAWSAPGSGRLEVNSSDPSGRKRGLASPSADLVSRRGGPPPGSIRQTLVRYFLPSALRVWMAAASQPPSGESRSAPIRGIATKSPRSWNGVVVPLPAAQSALTFTPGFGVDKLQFATYPDPRYVTPARRRGDRCGIQPDGTTMCL